MDLYGGSTDLLDIFPKCFEFLEKARKQNQKVLVHCGCGSHRSAVIIMAYLMVVNHWTLKEAYALLKEK
jgi:protein-tyrosine phosphatase